MPRSSTTVWAQNDVAGQQELRPRGPFSYAPTKSSTKDAFEKFIQDFQAANLPENKSIKPPGSTSRRYNLGQPCFEDKLQDCKICIIPSPSGVAMG